eukprot:gene10555-11675_t
MCSVCKRVFSAQRYLDMHMELKHSIILMQFNVNSSKNTASFICHRAYETNRCLLSTESQSSVSVKEVQWESGAYYTSSDTDFDSASDSASNSESDDTDTETISDDECDEDELEYNDRNEINVPNVTRILSTLKNMNLNSDSETDSEYEEDSFIPDIIDGQKGNRVEFDSGGARVSQENSDEIAG